MVGKKSLVLNSQHCWISGSRRIGCLSRFIRQTRSPAEGNPAFLGRSCLRFTAVRMSPSSQTSSTVSSSCRLLSWLLRVMWYPGIRSSWVMISPTLSSLATLTLSWWIVPRNNWQRLEYQLKLLTCCLRYFCFHSYRYFDKYSWLLNQFLAH